MQAITLTQPWASLVAIGAKRIETRSWGTSYRGPLAIHAAKGFPLEAVALCGQEPFATALLPGYEDTRLWSSGRRALSGPDIPTGAVVATCTLIDCVRIVSGDTARRMFTLHAAPEERSFGDYTVGRMMWLLGAVVRLPEPIPARGSLGLWEWEGTE
jgi:hypothetical protein